MSAGKTKRRELNHFILESQSKHCLSKELPTSTPHEWDLGHLLNWAASLCFRQRLIWQTNLVSFMTTRKLFFRFVIVNLFIAGTRLT